MKRLWLIAAMLLWSGAAFAKPIKVMLLDGASAAAYHNWQVTTQIIRVESDVTNCDLSLMRVNSRIGLSDTITLQHIEQGGLSCVV